MKFDVQVNGVGFKYFGVIAGVEAKNSAKAMQKVMDWIESCPGGWFQTKDLPVTHPAFGSLIVSSASEAPLQVLPSVKAFRPRLPSRARSRK